jgi:hypothetical protein
VAFLRLYKNNYPNIRIVLKVNQCNSHSCITAHIFFFFFLVSWGGVKLSPFGTLATNWPIGLFSYQVYHEHGTINAIVMSAPGFGRFTCITEAYYELYIYIKLGKTNRAMKM